MPDPSPTQLLAGLSEVAGRYDAILCDVWGVLHDGKRAFDRACAALKAFRTERGPVVLITNAPVPKARVTAVFPRVGVPDDCFDDVVASGDATHHELQIHAPGPVYPIGLSEDRSVYGGLDLDFTDDPARARVICCTSLREYPHGHPDDYRDELERLAAYRLPMICANPDIQFRHGDRLIWSAGALAAIYETLGGEVIRPGKPDAPIYRLAMERVAEISGRDIRPERVLGIGDGPATDVRGANAMGMDALFIGGGIHGHAMADGEGFLESAQAVLAADGAVARYAMPELSW
ncbi:MAG: TIGR01459 family HAD-type hydrolase [Alphaproteobacteria bacterium]|nr:TIGR01459 family HAD-type hydrolase [Alphaproteobacteria bacterium]